jgi:hypothetical protein
VLKPEKISPDGTTQLFRTEAEKTQAMTYYTGFGCRIVAETSTLSTHPFAFTVYPPPKNLTVGEALSRIAEAD